MISVDQCRAGRALLDWSAQQLATEAKVGVATVRRFEAGQAIADASLDAMQAALSRGGIVFIEPDRKAPPGGAGVRFSARTRDAT